MQARRLQAYLQKRIGQIGQFALFAYAAVKALRKPRRWWHLFTEEFVRQAYGALPLVMFLAILAGAVTSQQSGYQFEKSLPYWVIGTVVSASVITELAPIMTGIAVIGVVGARIAAELASMRVSEQVDALEMIGHDPVTYLVVPRVLAGALATPLLVAFALTCGIVAGWLTAIVVTPVTTPDFWYGVRYYVRDFPPFFALMKGLLFGLSATVIATYIGLNGNGGSEGVGQATTSAVVAMIASLLIIDVTMAPLLKIVRL